MRTSCSPAVRDPPFVRFLVNSLALQLRFRSLFSPDEKERQTFAKLIVDFRSRRERIRACEFSAANARDSPGVPRTESPSHAEKIQTLLPRGGSKSTRFSRFVRFLGLQPETVCALLRPSLASFRIAGKRRYGSECETGENREGTIFPLFSRNAHDFDLHRKRLGIEATSSIQ